MIVSELAAIMVYIVTWLASLLGGLFSIDGVVFQSIISYVSILIQRGSGLLFFFIPADCFNLCVDTVFIAYSLKVNYRAIMWLIRKIPFISLT